MADGVLASYGVDPNKTFMGIPSAPGQGTVVDKRTAALLSDTTIPIQQVQALHAAGQLNPERNPLVDQLIADHLKMRTTGATIEDLAMAAPMPQQAPPMQQAPPPMPQQAPQPEPQVQSPYIPRRATGQINHPVTGTRVESLEFPTEVAEYVYSSAATPEAVSALAKDYPHLADILNKRAASLRDMAEPRSEKETN